MDKNLMKNTKKELVNLLEGFQNEKEKFNEKGKELISLFKIDYKDNPKGFTKKDLVGYIEKVTGNLLNTQQVLPMENEEKKKVVVKKKEEVEKVNPEKEVKKVETKKLTKKITREEIIPSTFKSDLGTLVRVEESYDKILKLVDKGEQLYIASYWNPEQIKKFSYDLGLGLAEGIESFPEDLDILQVMYIDKTICYGLSLYSTQVYPLLKEDFDFVDTMRVSNGMEFGVYKVK